MWTLLKFQEPLKVPCKIQSGRVAPSQEMNALTLNGLGKWWKYLEENKQLDVNRYSM